MYNNYGYNPYYQPRYNGMTQQPNLEQPIAQPIQNNVVQNRSLLNGKSVDSIDVVKAMDIPLDGSISYFPIADGSAIVTKQLQIDGTSKTTIYKPIEENKENIKYITQEEFDKKLEKIDLSEIEDLKDEIKDLRIEFKNIQKKMKSKE